MAPLGEPQGPLTWDDATMRHDALLPLTHDHHHALVKARRMIMAAETGDQQEMLSAASDFLAFFRSDTLGHFHEEEEVLFPLLLEQEAEPPEELVRVLVDHVRIHGLVARLAEQVEAEELSADLVRGLGETLRAHVRLEENKLFPLIEQKVPDPALRAVHLAERDRTQPET
jgi:iron-sulfur cluster repair protein YtfE (RIC family)